MNPTEEITRTALESGNPLPTISPGDGICVGGSRLDGTGAGGLRLGGTRLGMIVGPTGAGKTAFAIALAERLRAEILNGDSRQLYRRMDLGTAKPDAVERARVPHHLIDVCEPDSPIDVAAFAELARAAIADIAARGRPILVVGGSGLYLRALRAGIFDGPPADTGFRAELSQIAAEHGPPYLHTRLTEIDPIAAGRVSPNDLFRIIRALEVHHLSGITISEHRRRHRSSGDGYPNFCIGLSVSRARLYERIDRRFDAMLSAGLIDEVRGLLTSDPRSATVIDQTIGYREIAQYLNGALDLPAAIDAAKRESRRLAKRQMTWFRREPHVVWLDPDDGIEQALRLFQEFFRGPAPVSALSSALPSGSNDLDRPARDEVTDTNR
jgi:tRNA dimethylallyltransferase